ncbi:hypothetical protein K435DRAFT_874652 [Dendrothele bispora CBS 962.96]|uniref:Uncharacterized protein n=1 Tax=Dendrothele bispora (strain CBS 962.96) TaxID=1314807 RepID=A0A4S8KW67_DENBC|nr:hypothetical protein K435DRAFT_877259 [Dendrothele bispora CBS 962.96]THU80187.1 hypothetical protein K435DRAFT_874652 [Dendrothele bispora CBS 962.96]
MQCLCTYGPSSCAGIIFASRIPGVGTSIDLDTDGIHLNDAAVESSTLASDEQPTAPSSTQVDNTGATQTQPQSTTAHTTSFATETTNAPTSTATFSPSVPSVSSSCCQDAESADYYNLNNEGVHFNVVSLDNGGGVEASMSRANAGLSQICTGHLRQPHMIYVDSILNAYGSTRGGYYSGVIATEGNTTSNLYSMGANPIAPVPSPAALPDTCNYGYPIGPNSGYGVDMAAIGGTTPAAGVAGIGVARMRSVGTTANTAPTTSNTVTSPFDFPEPAPAVSISQAHGGSSMLTTAFSINTVTGT